MTIPTEDNSTKGMKEQVEKLTLDVKDVNRIMVGVNLVMFVAFIALLVAYIGVTLDTIRFKSEKQDSVDWKLQSINAKLDGMLGGNEEKPILRNP